MLKAAFRVRTLVSRPPNTDKLIDTPHGNHPPNIKSIKIPKIEDIANRGDIPDMDLEVSHQIWTRQQLNLKRVPKPNSTKDSFFDHKFYSPKQRGDTDIGPIKGQGPLKWPEYDQSILSAQQMNLPSPPYWSYHEIENREDSALGNYPRYVPMQYAELRDPYKYWDQQNRRDFGEILYDHHNFTGILTPGPLESATPALIRIAKFFAVVVGVWALFELIDVDGRKKIMSEKDYPFDGLRVEQGGHPDDPDDYHTRRFMKFSDHKL